MFTVADYAAKKGLFVKYVTVKKSFILLKWILQVGYVDHFRALYTLEPLLKYR